MKNALLFLIFFAAALAQFDADKISAAIVNISSNDAQRDLRPFSLSSFFEDFSSSKFYGISAQDFKKNLGSGLVIDKKGYILTAYSNIENVKKIFVRLDSQKLIPATLVGIDNAEDLAVLKIAREDLSAFAYSKNVIFKTGDDVYVLSKPLSDKPFVSNGLVAFITADADTNGRNKYIILNGSINPLASGGALLSANGELLGMINAKFSKENGAKGFFIATPIDIIRKSVSKILAGEDKENVWFGIAISGLEKQDAEYYKRDKGVIVISVEENSPAQLAGIKRGDLIISIDDVPIDNPQDLNYQISSMRPGDARIVEFQRDLKTMEAVVTLKSPPGKIQNINYSSSVDGLILEPLSAQKRRLSGIERDMNGVVVRSVLSATPAAKSGFMVDDIIIKIDGATLSGIDEFKTLVTGKTQTVTVFRKGIIKDIVWEKNE
ncbi:MAG: PDZ domain-containing protein [Helicobacteraceae bacterium]